MNKAILLLTLLLSFTCHAQKNDKPFQWNLERERMHNEHRNDSTTWSRKCWEADIQDVSIDGKPMIDGVFPVPDYDLVDTTFIGGGNSGAWKGIKLKEKTILFHSFYMKQCNVNRKFIPNKPNEVFFTIVALTDTIDAQRFTHTNVNVSSRNFPHYLGQGFVRTKTNEIDFMAFLSADRNSYAIVNMRLFDLRIGRIVLIAPQKDGTLRSLQLESPILSSKEMKDYIPNLLQEDQKVIEFFTQPGTI